MNHIADAAAGDLVAVVRAENVFDFLRVIGAVDSVGVWQELVVLCVQVHIEGDGAVGPAAEVERVRFRPAIDIVAKVAAGDLESVIAGLAVTAVLEKPAVNSVIAVAAEDRVRAAAAEQRVVAARAFENIVDAVAGDRVIII